MPREGQSGFVRGTHSFAVGFPTGTGAAECVTDYLAAFNYTIEACHIVASAIVAAGASASRTVNLVRTRGGVDTTIATGTVVLADLNTLGAVKALTLSTTPADLKMNLDTDTLSLMFAAGGTAFTAMTGTLMVRYRTKAQQQGGNI